MYTTHSLKYSVTGAIYNSETFSKLRYIHTYTSSRRAHVQTHTATRYNTGSEIKRESPNTYPCVLIYRSWRKTSKSWEKLFKRRKENKRGINAFLWKKHTSHKTLIRRTYLIGRRFISGPKRIEMISINARFSCLARVIFPDSSRNESSWFRIESPDILRGIVKRKETNKKWHGY